MIRSGTVGSFTLGHIASRDAVAHGAVTTCYGVALVGVRRLARRTTAPAVPTAPSRRFDANSEGGCNE